MSLQRFWTFFVCYHPKSVTTSSYPHPFSSNALPPVRLVFFTRVGILIYGLINSRVWRVRQEDTSSGSLEITVQLIPYFVRPRILFLHHRSNVGIVAAAQNKTWILDRHPIVGLVVGCCWMLLDAGLHAERCSFVGVYQCAHPQEVDASACWLMLRGRVGKG